MAMWKWKSYLRLISRYIPAWGWGNRRTSSRSWGRRTLQQRQFDGQESTRQPSFRTLRSRWSTWIWSSRNKRTWPLSIRTQSWSIEEEHKELSELEHKWFLWPPEKNQYPCQYAKKRMCSTGVDKFDKINFNFFFCSPEQMRKATLNTFLLLFHGKRLFFQLLQQIVLRKHWLLQGKGQQNR